MSLKIFHKQVYEPSFTNTMDWGEWDDPTFNVLYNYPYVSGTFIGTTLPGWKGIIRAGSNATTPAQGTLVDHTIGGGEARLTFESAAFPKRTQGHAMTGAFVVPVFATSPDEFETSAADTQARLKFLSKYRDRRSAFQSGTFFGELAETVRMIRRPASALRTGIDSYHRTARSRAAKERSVRNKNKAVAGTWLEYSYGWLPLISDVKDAIKLLDAQPRAYREVITANAKIAVEKFHIEGTVGFGFLKVDYRMVVEGSVSVRYKGAVSASIPEPSFAEQVGFNPSNFVPTIWNLIPYSFLVDYFTNIGSIIDGVSQGTIGLAWGCRTHRKIRSVKIGAANVDMVYANSICAKPRGSVNVSGYSSSFIEFGRVGVNSVGAGLSDIQFRVPGISSTKWLNIGALAHLASLKTI